MSKFNFTLSTHLFHFPSFVVGYKCLRSSKENSRVRGSAPMCLCGGWSNFCATNQVIENLTLSPYPHDKRCGCCICPDCRVGAPCATCPGNCVVCRGIVNPGPTEISFNWTPSSTSPCPVLPKSLTTVQNFALLFDACRNGNTGQVIAAMEASTGSARININICDNLRRSPLFYAIDSGNLECIQLLLNVYFANPSQSDCCGNTPLHHAVETSREDIVRAILSALQQRMDAVINLANADRVTPLMIAVNHSSIPIARLLLENGANHLAIDSLKRATLLHIAAGNGCLEICQLLIKKEISVDSVDLEKKTALHYAAEFGEVEVARLIYETKLNGSSSSKKQQSVTAAKKFLLAKDRYGKMALQYALSGGHAAMTQFLLSLDPANSVYETVGRSQKTTLMFAAEGGNAEVVRILLEFREHVSRMKMQRNDVSFMGIGNLLVGNKNDNMSEKQFLDLRSSSLSKKSGTAMCRAWQEGHFEVVALLIERGAELFMTAKQMLRECCSSASPSAALLVRTLLNCGKIKKDDLYRPKRETFLHCACFNPDVLEALLECTELPVVDPVDPTQSVTTKVTMMMTRDAPRSAVGLPLQPTLFPHSIFGIRNDVPQVEGVSREVCIHSFTVMMRHRRIRIADCRLIGDSVSVRSSINSSKDSTLFHFAVRSNFLDFFRSLISNDNSYYGLETDLMSSVMSLICEYNRQEFYLVLVNEFGIDGIHGIRSDGTSFCYLHGAVSHGSVDVVTVILDRGADVNEVQSDSLQTRPIHRVGNSVEMVILLIGRGASLVVRDGMGRSPLHHAAAGGHVDVMKYYLTHHFKRGTINETTAKGDSQKFHMADLVAKDLSGKTPLALAKSMKIQKIVLLIEKELHLRRVQERLIQIVSQISEILACIIVLLCVIAWIWPSGFGMLKRGVWTALKGLFLLPLKEFMVIFRYVVAAIVATVVFKVVRNGNNNANFFALLAAVASVVIINFFSFY